MVLLRHSKLYYNKDIFGVFFVSLHNRNIFVNTYSIQKSLFSGWYLQHRCVW